MIIVQQRLNEIFEQLPQMDGFKPVYKWGNEMHLMAQLVAYSEAGKSPYPLIYQTSTKSKQIERGERSATTRLRLVLACQNPQTELLNENRWAMSYANILFPLVELIIKAFNRSGIILWDEEYDLDEFPNYGNGQENHTIDIWDALVFEADVKILDNCINTINFNF